MDVMRISSLSMDEPPMYAGARRRHASMETVIPSMVRGEVSAGTTGEEISPSFGVTMSALLDRVDRTQHAATQKMDAVERGNSGDLVGAMVASQEASLSFSMLMQVRNKLAVAMDDLLKMQL